MWPNESPPDWSAVEIAVPRQPCRLPGISMAGFRQHAPAAADITMVAHPAVTLIVDLSEGDRLAYDAPDRRAYGSVVVGLAPGALRVSGRAAGGMACLQIRLSPLVAAAVLRAPTELSGAVVALDDVLGRAAGRIEDRLRAAASWDERFTIARDALERRLSPAPSLDPEVAVAWSRIRADRGRVRVDDLADQLSWSRKRLWSRFRAQVGLTPKYAARLVRFDHAAHLLAAGGGAAAVAVASGYVDQSHLHREVRAFTGVTPVAVAAAPWLAIDDVAWPTS